MEPEGRQVPLRRIHPSAVRGQKMTYPEGWSRAGRPYRGLLCPDRDCEGSSTTSKKEVP